MLQTGETVTKTASLLKKRLWDRCFLVIFAKGSFYKTPPVTACPNHGYLHRAILKALHGFQEKKSP